MHVELYPAERAAEIRGHLPAREPHGRGRSTRCTCCRASRRRDARGDASIAARALVVDDSPLRYRIYALERPLAPGDSIAMTFECRIPAARLPQRGRAHGRDSNGAYIERHLAAGARLPAGPRGDGRADAPRARPAAAQAAAERGGRGDADGRASAVRAGGRRDRSSAPSRARPPSRRARSCASGREKGRRYFHYRTDAPTRFGGAVLSAEYAVREDTANGRPAPRLLPSDARRERRPDDPQHARVARLLLRAVRSVPVPRAARRRVPALRGVRAGASAHDRVLGGKRVPHARRLRRRRPHVLRRRARDGAPVVGRAGDPRARAGRRHGVGDARAVQLDDGAGDGRTARRWRASSTTTT